MMARGARTARRTQLVGAGSARPSAPAAEQGPSGGCHGPAGIGDSDGTGPFSALTQGPALPLLKAANDPGATRSSRRDHKAHRGYGFILPRSTPRGTGGCCPGRGRQARREVTCPGAGKGPAAVAGLPLLGAGSRWAVRAVLLQIQDPCGLSLGTGLSRARVPGHDGAGYGRVFG